MINDSARQSSTLNLYRLLWLRLLLAGLLALAAWLAPILLGLQFARAPLAIVLCAILALTALAWWRAQRTAVAHWELFGHLCADTAALVAAMYFTGGYMNPLISLLLLPLVSAAALLPARYTWALTLATVLAYTVLMEHYEPLRIDQKSGRAASMFALHLAGMWVTFVLSALVVALFVARMSASVRSRDQALAQAREQMLRQQQVASLGALAAGAAHELGTPLATMAVIAHELALDARAAPYAQDLQVLAQQIEACKRIIARLQSRAGGAPGVLTLDAFLNELIEHWRMIRPAAQCRLELSGQGPAPRVHADAALAQAIVNLLNNAADASAQAIVLKARWSEQDIRVSVRDRGAGVPAQLLARLGRAQITTKAAGHAGLGLVLARSTAEHFGGELLLQNDPAGGLVASLRLPRAALGGASGA